MENWRVIPSFEHYEASDKGNVRSTNFEVVRKNGRTYKHRGQMLTQQINNDGYCFVQLYVNKKRFVKLVHRLVYEAFNGQLDDELVIDHINNDRTDNRLENLQLISSRENLQKDTWRHKKQRLPLGVSQQDERGYTAVITIDYVQYYLGSFKTIKEARARYVEANRKYEETGELPADLHRVRHKIVDGYKVCSCCGRKLPLSEYYISKGRVQGKCKSCFKKERMRIYKKNYPPIIKTHKEL